MQRFDRVYRPNDAELRIIIEKNKTDGFVVKQMIVYSVDYVLFLSEKETRKDKLDRLDDISKV